MSEPPLGALDLALGAAMVLANAGLTLALSLGLARTILVAAVRATVQLLLLGYVLRTIFALASPGPILAVLAVMAAAATHEIAARQERSLAGAWRYGLGGGTAAAATALVVALSLVTQIRPDPWYAPRYLIPLVGIVLGSTMSGISIGLNALTASVVRERNAVESRLALGATRDEALGPLVRSAVRAGLIPTLNQMAAAGLITLPGMMTGQILAGANPADAARYQLLVLFLISAASGLGVVAAVRGAVLRLTDDRHRLRLDRLRQSS